MTPNLQLVSQRTQPRPAPQPHQCSGRGTALIIEPSSAMAEVLNAVITQSDLPIYRSVVARNAEESEELLCTQQDIGLVAAECDIPTEGSQDLVFVLLQDQRLQGVPIVVLASIVDPRRIEKLLDLGAAAFFRIPFDPTLLQRQLAEVLERSTAAASLKED